MTVKNIITITAAVGFIGMASSASATIINNGSFETGDFTGWMTVDGVNSSSPLAVRPTGVPLALFPVIATDGNYAASHGFDGEERAIKIMQDIFITPDQTIIEFDYRAGWDMTQNGATQSRWFNVTVGPTGIGPLFAGFNFLLPAPGTSNPDTGNLVGQVDLSAFAGQDVRVSFECYIPESYTGPGSFQLDNIHAIPEPASLGLLSLISGGIYFTRRFFVD